MKEISCKKTPICHTKAAQQFDAISFPPNMRRLAGNSARGNARSIRFVAGHGRISYAFAGRGFRPFPNLVVLETFDPTQMKRTQTNFIRMKYKAYLTAIQEETMKKTLTAMALALFVSGMIACGGEGGGGTNANKPATNATNANKPAAANDNAAPANAAQANTNKKEEMPMNGNSGNSNAGNSNAAKPANGNAK